MICLLFDLQNYWIFIALCAAIYVAISTFLQANIGGKDSLRSLQLEMRQMQMKMGEAGKKHDDKALDKLMGENMALTMKLMVVQMQFAFIILFVFFGFAMLFTAVEPGAQDDYKFPLYDDALAAHCDLAANDGIYSGCYAVPENASKGAWVIDVSLKSPSGEQLSRSGVEIFVDGGVPSDVWVQNVSQGGLLEMAMGKTQYHLNVSVDNDKVSRGGTVSLHASSAPPVPQRAISMAPHLQGATYEASSNMGTFFYVDLPVTLPLLNIRRIIGSTGVLIFSAFLLSIAYSLSKAIYDSVLKKKN